MSKARHSRAGGAACGNPRRVNAAPKGDRGRCCCSRSRRSSSSNRAMHAACSARLCMYCAAASPASFSVDANLQKTSAHVGVQFLSKRQRVNTSKANNRGDSPEEQSAFPEAGGAGPRARARLCWISCASACVARSCLSAASRSRCTSLSDALSSSMTRSSCEHRRRSSSISRSRCTRASSSAARSALRSRISPRSATSPLRNSACGYRGRREQSPRGWDAGQVMAAQDGCRSGVRWRAGTCCSTRAIWFS